MVAATPTTNAFLYSVVKGEGCSHNKIPSLVQTFSNKCVNVRGAGGSNPPLNPPMVDQCH